MARVSKDDFYTKKSYKDEESFKRHVEWLTGGRDGGTCHRPDIVTRGPCDPCEYVKFCLCHSRSLTKKK